MWPIICPLHLRPPFSDFYHHRNDHDHDNDEQNDEESILEDDDAYARTVSSAWHRASRCALVAREMSATSPDSVRGFRHVIASLLGGRSLEVEDALAVVSDATESDALSVAAALAVAGVARGDHRGRVSPCCR